MKNLSKEIDNLIRSELSSINQKINGVILLEILKYKILDNLKNIIDNFSFENIEQTKSKTKIEDNHRIITFELISCKSALINLNFELKSDLLIISLNKQINININDRESKKNFNFKCIPLTGIVLSKDSKCSVNYIKNSVILELSLQEKITNIEKSEEYTI